jgi:4-alpha-glucanotransferase
VGFLDKAKDLLGKHEEKVESAIDKVAEVVDDKTGGKHTDKIEKGVEAAKGFVGDEEGGTPPVPPAVP